MLLSSPMFTKAWIRRQGGPAITVAAPDASPSDVYVRSVTVNGAPWSRSWVPASLLNEGGEIRFALEGQPDRNWGTGPGDLPVDHGMP